MESPPQNSKSLVLITRVGSTPTTGIKRKLPQTSWGSFLFYLRRVRREQHRTISQKKRPDFVGTFLFYLRCACGWSGVQICLILPLQGMFFACRICVRSAARLFREWLSVLPKGRTLTRKKCRNAAPPIYSAVSCRFYNVFYEKDFTNEFQKHII